MKLIMNDALNFRNFHQLVREHKFSLRTGYRLNCIIKALEPHLSYYQEQLASLIEEYSERDDKNNIVRDENGNFKIPQEKIAECNERLQELLTLELDVEFKPLPIEEIESLELPIEQVQGIFPFITE